MSFTPDTPRMMHALVGDGFAMSLSIAAVVVSLPIAIVVGIATAVVRFVLNW